MQDSNCLAYDVRLEYDSSRALVRLVSYLGVELSCSLTD